MILTKTGNTSPRFFAFTVRSAWVGWSRFRVVISSISVRIPRCSSLEIPEEVSNMTTGVVSPIPPATLTVLVSIIRSYLSSILSISRSASRTPPALRPRTP